jgi:hypothetical protein
MTEVENLLESVGGHRRGVGESETWLMKPCGDSLLSVFRALASDEQIYSIPDTEQKPPSDLVLRGAG